MEKVEKVDDIIEKIGKVVKSGPAGESPDGKSRTVIAHVDGMIVMTFDVATYWLTMSPSVALDTAIALIEHARAAADVNHMGIQVLDRGTDQVRNCKGPNCKEVS